VVLLRKELMEGVILKPGRGGDAAIGSVFVSIGESALCQSTLVVDHLLLGSWC